jgi:hypothetical protein
MTNCNSSRLARKRPTPEGRYPTAAEVAAALHGNRQADGSYMCRCPCPLHRNGDRDPSLSVRDGRDGRLLLYCFAAGGGYRDIIDALVGRGVWPRQR